MIAVLPLLAVLLLGVLPDASAPQPSKAAPAQKQFTPEQEEQIRQEQDEFKKQHEAARQEAVRINDLAGKIHSEADARQVVDSIAEQLTHHQHLFWAAQSFRHRVAHAEYEAVSDTAGLIPEQRVVDVWNEYVREIDAPEEALITVAELHALRAAQYRATSRYLWKQDSLQTIWSMPNIFAVDKSGQVADGCRALETLRMIYAMHEMFGNVRSVRERIKSGVLTAAVEGPASSEKKVVAKAPALSLRAVSQYTDPINPAARRYEQEHGGHAYDQMVRRLFDELFPAE